MVLFGKEYRSKLLDQTKVMQDIETISKTDLELFLVTDSVTEGMNYINTKLETKYGAPLLIRTTKSKWWLGEKGITAKKQKTE